MAGAGQLGGPVSEPPSLSELVIVANPPSRPSSNDDLHFLHNPPTRVVSPDNKVRFVFSLVCVSFFRSHTP